MLPITYASHAMPETETHYAQINKEALMTTWACECFSNYLIGLYFPIENNHKPLVPLLGSKHLGELSARLQRFDICLMRYGYTICYVPENNTLSRAVLSNGLFKQDKGKNSSIHPNRNGILTFHQKSWRRLPEPTRHVTTSCNM